MSALVGVGLGLGRSWPPAAVLLLGAAIPAACVGWGARRWAGQVLRDRSRSAEDAVTQWDQRLQEARTQNARLETILAGMGEAVVVTNRRGGVVLTNPAFHRLFRVASPVAGRTLLEVVRHPAVAELVQEVLRAGRGDGVVREVELAGPPDCVLRGHAVPLFQDGQGVGSVVVFHDVTEVRRLESVRREFVANVSHELRTPLTSIQGYAETLLQGALTDPPRSRAFVETIHRHAAQLGRLIDGLLHLARVESGIVEPEKTPQPLLPLIQEVAELIAPRCREKPIAFAIDHPERLPTVLMHRDYIRQVLLNLVENAVSYTPAHGAVTVRATPEAHQVVVEVADTGIGIPAEVLPRVFERFYRVDPARARQHGGTGLGLAIVKHLVQAHGGEVSVDSTPGKGSVFRFTLPAAR